MSSSRIQWIAISVPALLIGAFESLRHGWLEHQLPGHLGNILGALLVGIGVSVFVRYYTGLVARIERDLGRSRAEAAVLAERQRIARDMHDSIAQALFHLRVRLEDLNRYARQGDRSAIRKEIGLLQRQLTSAYDQVRIVITDLRQQTEIEDTGESLRRTAVEVAEKLGLNLQISLSDVPRLDATGRQHLLAIVSETLTNARRHGEASTATLTADRQQLIVTDHGRGFDPNRPGGKGFGLMIMEERARMIGGELEIESEPGRGTRIILQWEGAARGHASSDR